MVLKRENRGVGPAPEAPACRTSLFGAGRRHEGSIHAVSKSDGKARELVRGLQYELILPLEVFEGSLYFATKVDDRKARLEAIRLADGTRRTLAEFEGGSPFIAVDRCGVYYSTSSGIERARSVALRGQQLHVGRSHNVW